MTGFKPYRPSNGTEGECFMGQWCAHCERDKASREPGAFPGDGCEIIANTMAYSIDDPNYPKEWRCDGPSGPRCTAFTPEGDDPIFPLDPAAVVRDLFPSHPALKAVGG